MLFGPTLLSLCLLAHAAHADVMDPTKFSQEAHWNGLGACVKMVVAATSGEVFCGLKNGVITRFPSVKSGPGDSVMVYDGSSYSASYGDKGLLGLAVDPNYPEAPYIWAFMSVNRLANPAVETAPLPVSNSCPDGDDGNVASGRCDSAARLIRIRVTGQIGTVEQVLAQDWCSNGFSHHIGNIAFASDKSLLLTAGDGSSFTIQDRGNPTSPCWRADDTHGAQGSYRAQWDNFVHGKMLRISYGDLTANRLLTIGAGLTIVAKGLRNPFRWAIHPTTGDVYVGDVGSEYREEINLVPNPITATSIPNFGWPCFEGTMRHPWYGQEPYCAALSTSIPPWFMYARNSPMTFVNGGSEHCLRGTVSPSAFAFRAGNVWGDQYANALFWADSSQQCLMQFSNDAKGMPDPTKNNLISYNSPTGTNAKWVDLVFAGDNNADLYAVEYDQSGTSKFKVLGVASPPSGGSPGGDANPGTGGGGSTAPRVSAASAKQTSPILLWLAMVACIIGAGGLGFAGTQNIWANGSTGAIESSGVASRRLRQRRSYIQSVPTVH